MTSSRQTETFKFSTDPQLEARVREVVGLYLDPPAHAIRVVNLVEVFFAIIERQALRRGDFACVEELMAAIRRFCDDWNQRCHPCTWTKDADQIPGQARAPTTSATGH